MSRTRLFFGRAEHLRRLHAYWEAADPLPLVVTGAPGSGKSALLAQFVLESRQRRPGLLVLPHFVGAVPGTTRLTVTLRSLLEALRRAAGLSEELPADPEKLRPLLPKSLEQAAAGRPVLLVLDAVNQLDPAERSHSLDWLPATLPAGVRLVVSTLPGDCADVLRRRADDDHWLAVDGLPEDARRRLVREHLRLRGKQLTEGQLARLLDRQARPEAELPLYLLAALEELCLFGSFEALDLRLERLPGTVAELFTQVLARLEHDHGRELVELLGGAVAVSRSGLSEAEILDLLRRRWPDFAPARWTRLYRGLQFYLRPMDEEDSVGLVGFFHDQLRFAAFRRYLDMAAPEAEPGAACRRRHADLAEVFEGLARADEPRRWRADQPRALNELPYHRLQAGRPETAEQLLLDLCFLEAKAEAGLVFDLAADFGAAVRAMPAGRPRRLQLLEEALRQDLHFVARHPETLFQGLWNLCCEVPQEWWTPR